MAYAVTETLLELSYNQSYEGNLVTLLMQGNNSRKITMPKMAVLVTFVIINDNDDDGNDNGGDDNNNNNNNNNKGSIRMGEVAPLQGVHPALVLTDTCAAVQLEAHALHFRVHKTVRA